MASPGAPPNKTKAAGGPSNHSKPPAARGSAADAEDMPSDQVDMRENSVPLEADPFADDLVDDGLSAAPQSLPDRHRQEKTLAPSVRSWDCPKCSTAVDPSNTYCPHCRTRRPSMSLSPQPKGSGRPHLTSTPNLPHVERQLSANSDIGAHARPGSTRGKKRRRKKQRRSNSVQPGGNGSMIAMLNELSKIRKELENEQADNAEIRAINLQLYERVQHLTTETEEHKHKLKQQSNQLASLKSQIAG